MNISSSHISFLNLILVYILFPCVLSVKYHYITINGTIHSSSSQIEKLGNDTGVVASAIYEDNVNKTGWANLELSTYDKFSDEEQSYFAGFLEGFITGDLIQMFYKNRKQGFCNNKKQFCNSLKAFVDKNNAFVKEMIQKLGETDPYWHQLSLIYKQLEGMEAGYKSWKTVNNKQLNEDNVLSDILMLNLESEIDDLEEFLSPERVQYEGHCSAIIKLLSNGSDLLISHNTWADYNSMLRIMKKYSFAFKSLPNKSKLIPGHSVSFPSYPGTISSTDDYYILSSGLVVQETTIDNYNDSLWQNIHANALVFEFARNIIANSLATSGKEWTDIFGQHNSGTYNNQFMIVDYNKFKAGTKSADLSDGLLWIIEQMPGLIRAADVTQVVREQGYWASYNVPYFKDIFDLSGNQEMVQKNGPYFSFNMTARANIFHRDQSKVVDMKSLYKLMRYNDFKNDPLSLCKVYNKTCIPPYSADFAIAARNDLNDPNGKYPIYDFSHRSEGAIDVKITNSKMVWDLEMLAVCGPTNEQQPSFQWSKSDFKSIKHEGHPDLFDFKPIYVKWYPNSYENATDVNKK